nr:5703_t:CDS:10 [Entrophospora candida]
MNSLELNLHAIILDELSNVLGTDPETTKEEVSQLIKRCLPMMPMINKDEVESENLDFKAGLMTKALFQDVSALAFFASITTNESYVDEILPILLNYLKNLARFSYEENLTWKEVFSLLGKLGAELKTQNAEHVCTIVIPILNGLLRSIESSHHPWHFQDFEYFAHQTQTIIDNDTLQEVQQIIETILKSSESHHIYVKRFLSRYQNQGFPISGNGLLYYVTKLLKSVLARSMFTEKYTEYTMALMSFNDIWSILINQKAENHLPIADYVKKTLRRIYVMSLQYFSELKDLLDNLVAQDNDCLPSLYAREIMAVSLDLAALASICLIEFDDELISKLTSSLFNVPQTPDVKVQVAALDAATFLALNFPQTTLNMIQLVRKFLITPSTIFELAVTVDKNLTILEYAIVRLAHCLKAVDGDTSRSVIYNLLTLLQSGGHDLSPVSSKNSLTPVSTLASDTISVYSSISSTSHTEEQRQQIFENIVCTVTGVIAALAVSMLGYRLRNHTPALDALILEKFVDIALISSEKIFTEIVRKFNDISHESLSPENKMVTTAVLKCQMDLASRIKSRPEFYRIFLNKILTLFVDKGVVIQQIIAKNGRFQITSLAGEIGILLPVLKTLLSHDDFKVHLNVSKELVELFRNLWFHCVLYGFVSEADAWIREWRDSLVLIAQKTPPLVQEGATNYLESDLEYNSVLRRGNSDQDLANLRSSLSSYLPNHASEIKYFSFAEITFLLSVYHIEIMRSQSGQCSFIHRYLVNQGVNTSKLVGCMEEIGNQVMDVFINECSKRVISHTINENVYTQVRNLMIVICHRLSKVHQLAVKQLDKLIIELPSLLCNKKLLYLLLELVELIWQSCENEYTSEYSPEYKFSSPKVGVTLDIPDSYNYRREMLSSLCEYGRKWILLAMMQTPSEIRILLQDYLAEVDLCYSENVVHMGRSIAIDVAKTSSKADRGMKHFSTDNISEFMKDYTSQRYYSGQIIGAQHWLTLQANEGENLEKLPIKIVENVLEKQSQKIKNSLANLEKKINDGAHVSLKELNHLMHLASNIIIELPKADEDLIHYLIWIPIYIFTPDSLKLAKSVWSWVINERSSFEKKIMVEIMNGWVWAMKHHKGLFSPLIKGPFVNKMQYAPSDKATQEKTNKIARNLFSPHLIWINFLADRFQAFHYRSTELVQLYIRLFLKTLNASSTLSNHTLSLEGRLQILINGFKLIQSHQLEASTEYIFRRSLFGSAFNWFSLPPRWPYGGNKRCMIIEYKLLIELYKLVEIDKPELNEILSAIPKKYLQYNLSNISTSLIVNGDKTKDEILKIFSKSKKLLLVLLESEIANFATWINPLNIPSTNKESISPNVLSDDSWQGVVQHAWSISPRLAIQLANRFKQVVIQSELQKIMASKIIEAVNISEALPLLLGDKLNQNVLPQLKYLLYWAPVPPITAITYFSPAFNNNPLILQYAMRALEYHPVDVVFFYIPQIVQALRNDFLERIIKNITDSLSGKDKEFYEREFTFFNNVTSISGKLKPFIKKSKPEKKKKIDEEMAKIKVDVGVYLPSNPEGKVIDIDYTSGRPLQSHAKAPFMATFKIRKTRHDSEEVKEALIHTDSKNEEQTIDVWQSAIFKVGDDCRQDVLALQLIAIFKNIFTSVGLDLYLFPYRVVATAPGCGVIDVIPNSISRDQLGREKVNSLYDYFLTRYGGLDSISFQKARNCFIQSAAAYSVVSFLLQIKDRHNGNIMLDDEGHIIHIDFGFILDIAPGGITFESSPFKLTTEMIQVMGGGTEEQPFKWFSELCIKAYLSSRPYAEQIMQCVGLMLSSGLPCFRGETLKRLCDRFQLDRNERRAADFMIEKINQSFGNKRTVWYDSFQKATNGIPY